MKVERIAESEIEELKSVGIEALKVAKTVHDELGEEGIIPVLSPNQFGEQALKADVEAEKAILEVLANNKVPIRVISEEHGITDITPNPHYLGVLDGIDGSRNYLEGRNKLRYATMFGVFSNLDPRYSDYIFSGMMEHAADNLWYAVAGQGAWVLDLNTQNQMVVKPSNNTTLSPTSHIYSAALWYGSTQLGKELEEFLKPYPTTQATSCAISFIDLASGTFDLQVEITRKGNLE